MDWDNDMVITFKHEPIGTRFGKFAFDPHNVYISEIIKGSSINLKNLTLGSKLISINGINIEGYGFKQINERLEQSTDSFPLHLKFRIRSEFKAKVKIELGLTEFQTYEQYTKHQKYTEFIKSLPDYGSVISHPQ
eukprot:206513_1